LVDPDEKMSSGGFIKSIYHIKAALFAVQYWGFYVMNSVEISGHPKRSWLRHCVTSRKFAGLISDGLIGIFHGHNPSGRTMTLGSNPPLTKMNTRYISWGVNAAGA
jgi:hypothetical protein